jgi:1-acyl-sn-glycerol-3-phosphate acyltransferase
MAESVHRIFLIEGHRGLARLIIRSWAWRQKGFAKWYSFTPPFQPDLTKINPLTSADKIVSLDDEVGLLAAVLATDHIQIIPTDINLDGFPDARLPRYSTFSRWVYSLSEGMLRWLRFFMNPLYAHPQFGNATEISKSALMKTPDLSLADEMKKIFEKSGTEIEEMKAATRGGDIPDFNDTLQEIVHDPVLKNVLEKESSRQKIELALVQEETRRILQKMIGRLNPLWLALARGILSLFRLFLYEKMVTSENDLSRLRQALLKHTIVLAPTHKSYVDFCLISYLFGQKGLPLPYIAAGENMDIFPLNFIFRNSGAFFIRREVSVDHLYFAVLMAFQRFLLRTGRLQEFFIEGARSRDGRVMPAKYGYLTLLLENEAQNLHQNESRSKPLAILPISISYERLLEEGAFLGELKGKRKKKETIFGFFKALFLLKNKFGNIQVSFGDFTYPDCSQFQSSAQKRKTVRQVGGDITDALDRHTVIPESSLLATAILSHSGGILQRDVILERAFSLFQYLQKTAKAEPFPQKFDLEKKLAKMVGWEYLRKVPFKPHYLVIVPGARLKLNIYKNLALKRLAALAVSAFSHPSETLFWMKPLSTYLYFTQDQWTEQMTDATQYVAELKDAEALTKRTHFRPILNNVLGAYFLVLDYGCSRDFPLLTTGMGTIKKLKEWGQTFNEANPLSDDRVFIVPEVYSKPLLESAIAFSRICKGREEWILYRDKFKTQLAQSA